MHSRTIRPVRGFTLIELLIVVGLISVLLTIGAAGLRGLGGKGVTSAVSTTEAIFAEARAIAVGKGTTARVIVDMNDPQDMDNYKRRILIAYLELDDQGEPTENWVLASRATLLPDRVFFSETFSKKNHKTGDSTVEEDRMTFDKQSFSGNYAFYEFNSEGICTTPGTSFVIGYGSRAQGERQPRVTGEGKRDFGGFIVWRKGGTSLFRSPNEIDVPAQTTTF